QRTVCTVDLRNPSEAYMDAAEADLRAALEEIGRATGVEITARRTAQTPPVAFGTDLQDLVAEEMDAVGLSHRRLISGAGTAAGGVAALAPTAMIFVPGEYDGISHNPREYSTPEACAAGVGTLLAVMRRLARAS